jgi:hypothetical protein
MKKVALLALKSRKLGEGGSVGMSGVPWGRGVVLSPGEAIAEIYCHLRYCKICR